MSSGPSFHKQLSREVVVHEALDLLDEEGLDALTMRNLADRLGVVPNALYRHVNGKDDLLNGVMDAAVATVALPSEDLSWPAGLTALAENVRATMLAHPTLAGLIVTRPNLGPAALRIGEYAFGLMLEAGFAPADADRSLNLVLTYTLGFVALEVPRRRDPETTASTLTPAYEQLSAEMFPNTARVMPNPMDIVSEAQFSFGLRHIIDGLHAMAP